jgi:hypothetical protein
METKKPYKESTKQKDWFFEKINNVDRPHANLTKMRKEKTHISKIRNAGGEITTNTKEIQGIITDCYENLCSNNLKVLMK